MTEPGASPVATGPACLVKVSRLLKRADFVRLATGRKHATPGLVLQMAPSPEGSVGIRVGFTATRRIGNAVVRNRAKRRLREIARTLMPLYAVGGCDYVLIAREATPTRPFAALVEDLKVALRKVHGAQSRRTEKP